MPQAFCYAGGVSQDGQLRRGERPTQPGADQAWCGDAHPTGQVRILPTLLREMYAWGSEKW